MDDVTLYTGECAAVMRDNIPDGSIDLTVTSPPYDNLRTYRGFVFDFEAIAAQLWRVTKPGGVVVWVVDDQKQNGTESGESLRQVLRFMDIGFSLHDKMIYEGLNGAMAAPDEYLQCFEMMFVLSKGKPQTVNLLHDRRNVRFGLESTPKTKRGRDGDLAEIHMVERSPLGRRKNIWSYAVGGKTDGGNHPAQFPEALARDHIASWSNPGDLVLDPMMGSGTTGKMAVLAQRRFIGIDIAAEYVELARERIGRAQLQPPLITLPSNNGFHLTAAQVGLWDNVDDLAQPQVNPES